MMILGAGYEEGQYCRQETIAFAEALCGHIAAFDMGFL